MKNHCTFQFQYLTVLSVEVHAASRGDLRPDPEVDPVEAIFYSIFNDIPPEKGTRRETGVLIVDAESANQNQDSATSSMSDPSPSSAKKKKTDSPKPSTSSGSGSQKRGMTLLQRSGLQGVKVIYVKDELELFKRFIAFVHR